MKPMPAKHDADRIAFRRRDFKGSRFRFLLATSVPGNELVAWIHSLVQPLAEVGLQHRYMPHGFRCPQGAGLRATDRRIGRGGIVPMIMYVERRAGCRIHYRQPLSAKNPAKLEQE